MFQVTVVTERAYSESSKDVFICDGVVGVRGLEWKNGLICVCAGVDVRRVGGGRVGGREGRGSEEGGMEGGREKWREIEGGNK